MIARSRAWLLQWLIALDQLLAVTLCAPFFVLLGRGQCPGADETISSIVGRAAIHGHRWALILERVIDYLFVQIGSEPGHCRRAIEWDEVIRDAKKRTVG